MSRGVAYAFVKAGAPCVIANLLPVEDQGAATLGEAFYQAAREHGVGEAMRRARQQLSGQVNVALLTATVVIGNPFVTLGGDSGHMEDATSRLFRDVAEPAAKRSTRGTRKGKASDPRLAAARDFVRGAQTDDEAELETLARVARDIGDEIGEAQCWLTLVEQRRQSSDAPALADALTSAIAVLGPLRGVWEPAFDAHRDAVAELRALDPGYQPRTLQTIRTASGLSVNDRSDPAVDAALRILEAPLEHEAHWRGEPVLRVPDFDAASIAHNAVVWGFLNRVSDPGAEVGVASAFAARAAWRGLVSEEAVPHLQRILTGLLRFIWGKQKVQHLEHWMASAHRDVIVLAIERVKQHWTSAAASPALSATREIAAALDQLFTAPAGRSKFAQAREALQMTASPVDRLEAVHASIETTVRRLHALDPYEAADFGAWVLGDCLTRASAATSGPVVRREVALACTALYDRFAWNQEGWFMPYLMDGYKAVREGGGQDVFAQWSADLL